MVGGAESAPPGWNRVKREEKVENSSAERWNKWKNTKQDKESLLPERWKIQVGAEDLLHPEGRDCLRLIPIGVAIPGPTLLDISIGPTKVGKVSTHSTKLGEKGRKK